MPSKVDRIARVLLAWPRPARKSLVGLVDIVLCLIAGWLAFALRIGDWDIVPVRLATFETIALAAWLSSAVVTNPYRAVVRYSGRETVMQLLRTCMIMSVVLAVALLVLQIRGIPRTLAVLHPMIFFFAAAGARIQISSSLIAAVQGGGARQRNDKRVLIYGAGPAGQQLAQSMRQEPGLTAVGFVDENESFRGNLLDGKPIWHVDDLEQVIAMEDIHEIFVALPNLKRSARRAIIERIRQTGSGVRVRTLPSISEIAFDQVSISDLREVQIEELLGRDEVAPDRDLMSRNIHGKIVLVTGAGGSIGSELCRQILRLGPTALVLADQSEKALYDIDSELWEIHAREGLESEIFTELVNVADPDQCDRLFDKWKPETVYHAAAYKHVPLVELNPVAGLRNNVHGTLYSALAAEKAGTNKFVLVSTDKAVRPTNVMGASKRVCELIIQARATLQDRTSYASVRFGNVLGSSGSVVPRFRQQIAGGGPVTITHREATRYFMTIPEASQLVIQAGALAHGGEVLLLDMGQPVRILDLARAMIELTGLSVLDEKNPDGDIEIEEIGLRPGEKLIEELLIGAPSEGTEHPRIIKARESMMDWAELEPQLARLKRALDQADAAEAVGIILMLVPEFTPQTWTGEPTERGARILHLPPRKTAPSAA